MPHAYIPLLIYALLAAACPVFCFVRLRTAGPETLENAENAEGTDQGPRSSSPSAAAGKASDTVPASFIAAVFVILSAECVFLFAWAVKFEEMGGYGLILLLVFAGIPLVGYVWLYRKGIFDSI